MLNWENLHNGRLPVCDSLKHPNQGAVKKSTGTLSIRTQSVGGLRRELKSPLGNLDIARPLFSNDTAEDLRLTSPHNADQMISSQTSSRQVQSDDSPISKTRFTLKSILPAVAVPISAAIIVAEQHNLCTQSVSATAGPDRSVVNFPSCILAGDVFFAR